MTKKCLVNNCSSIMLTVLLTICHQTYGLYGSFTRRTSMFIPNVTPREHFSQLDEHTLKGDYKP